VAQKHGFVGEGVLSCAGGVNLVTWAARASGRLLVSGRGDERAAGVG